MLFTVFFAIIAVMLKEAVLNQPIPEAHQTIVPPSAEVIDAEAEAFRRQIDMALGETAVAASVSPFEVKAKGVNSAAPEAKTDVNDTANGVNVFAADKQLNTVSKTTGVNDMTAYLSAVEASRRMMDMRHLELIEAEAADTTDEEDDSDSAKAKSPKSPSATRKDYDLAA